MTRLATCAAAPQAKAAFRCPSYYGAASQATGGKTGHRYSKGAEGKNIQRVTRLFNVLKSGRLPSDQPDTRDNQDDARNLSYPDRFTQHQGG